ncbi:MAG: hypothetical protein JNL01_15995 [Bdellovibrionales bacterium]|nr:hypothetical protein [Bdellovibrionales bacterium]
MKKMNLGFSVAASALVSLALFSTTAYSVEKKSRSARPKDACPVALSMKESLQIDDFKGSTFYEFMTDSSGVKASLDQDYSSKFKIADHDTILKAAKNFDDDVYKKIVRLFARGEQGLADLVDKVKGKLVTPGELTAMIRTKMTGLLKDRSKGGLAPLIVGPLIAMGSGAGTVVHINSTNYYYNFGYKSGEDAGDEKSGRSFGASFDHNALDVSDNYYLKELTAYLKDNADTSTFFKIFFNVLTNCDTSNYTKLSNSGQTVMTDLIAVYTAEQDRHIMGDMRSHPWENDLAETTMMSAYTVNTGKIIADGQYVNGIPNDFYAVGPSGRSGLGVGRKDRMKLQTEISKAMWKLHPDLTQRFADMIRAKKDTDLFHGLMLFINNPYGQDKVRAVADDLVKTVVEFLQTMRDDAAKIDSMIKKKK